MANKASSSILNASTEYLTNGNMHEIEEREVDFTPDRDIAAYMRNNQIK